MKMYIKGEQINYSKLRAFLYGKLEWDILLFKIKIPVKEKYFYTTTVDIPYEDMPLNVYRRQVIKESWEYKDISLEEWIKRKLHPVKYYLSNITKKKVKYDLDKAKLEAKSIPCSCELEKIKLEKEVYFIGTQYKSKDIGFSELSELLGVKPTEEELREKIELPC